MKAKHKLMTPRVLNQLNDDFRYLTMSPDGEEIIVDWRGMDPGMSVFLPCLNFQRALDEFNYICNVMDWTFDYVVRVESGKIGIRFWRLS
jgi:hypothetical protein